MNRKARRKHSTKGGFSLIEAMVFLFLFSVITMTFYQLYAVGSRHILDAKRRLGAVALANQRMEMVRGMPHGDIGTKTPNGSGGWNYGIPAGEILENETVAASDGTYDVHTFVQYADDPFDGVAGGGDPIPADFKLVRVSVSWGEDPSDAFRTIAVFGTFAQDGVEQFSGTGVLSVNVLDRDGIGVPQATVHVENVAAGVDLTALTGNDGNLMLPGAPPGEGYGITVSKNGYYGATTYPSAPLSAFDPVDVHASVVADDINSFSIYMDRDSDFVVRTVDPFGDPVPDIDFHLEGGRHIATDYTDTLGPAKIYGFSLDDTTDDSGEVGYANESYGRYHFSLDSSETEYELLPKHFEAVDRQEFLDLDPGVSRNFDVVVLDTSLNSMLFTVTDNNPTAVTALSGATVRLSDIVSGYDVSLTTDTLGRAYFPESIPELVPGTYSYETSLSGYPDSSGTVEIVSGLRKMTVRLGASVCTGSVPTNAAVYSGDEDDLSENTSYMYSATDTSARCEFSCDSGYSWNGSTCVVASSTCQSFGNCRGLENRAAYATRDRPYFVAVGDFNGDGSPDVVTADYGSHRVSVFRNLGDGTFASADAYWSGWNPVSVTADDFDGDGYFDLALVNYSSDVLSVMRNDGDGTFSGSIIYSTGNFPSHVASADLDTDGRPDILTVDSGSDRISVFRNQGDGNFASRISYDSGNNPHSVSAGDFNGDGYPDPVSTDYDADRISVFLGCPRCP